MRVAQIYIKEHWKTKQITLSWGGGAVFQLGVFNPLGGM